MDDEGMEYRVLLWCKRSTNTEFPQILELSGKKWLVLLLSWINIKFRIDVSESSSSDINIKNLMKYDAVILSSTTDIGVSLDDKQKSDFKNWYERWQVKSH